MNNNQTQAPEIPKKKKSKFREYVEAILIAVLIALFIRSFGIEAFKIPSSSMVPTLLIGDHIFVNKFVYGMRIPLTKIRFLEFKKPERGDVVVFMYPEDEGKDFIKRVIGLPGDEIEVRETDIYVNGVLVEKKGLSTGDRVNGKKIELFGSAKYPFIPEFPGWQGFDYYEEKIDKNDFLVQYERLNYHRSGKYTVPDGYFFVMGDNRDNSSDSREWGFVPMKNIKGQAMFIWLSLDRENTWIRFNRVGRWID